jgi:hypothetical protein
MDDKAAIRYLVPADTPGCVRQAAGREKWKPYRTECAWVFDRYERRTTHGYVFLYRGWLLHVKARFVEEISPEPI